VTIDGLKLTILATMTPSVAIVTRCVFQDHITQTAV